jgi:uncharacterized delta-60 repeat protein
MALLCLYGSAQVGSLDPAFNPAGYPPNIPAGGGVVWNSVGHNDYATGITTYPDGRILVVAYTEEKAFTVTRYLANGTVDGTFGSGGTFKQQRITNNTAISYAVKLLSDGSILLAGSDWANTDMDFALLKLLPNGTPDVNFGPDGDGWVETDIAGHDEARAIAVQNDGSIVLAGYRTSTLSTPQDFVVVRYSAAGIIDNGFGTGGKVITDIAGNDMAESVAIQTDGKIVVGGTSNINGADPNFTVIRYNSNGSLDNTGLGFGTGGIATYDLATRGTAGSDDQGHALFLQPDGKILLAGKSKGVSTGNGDMAVIRLTTTGALDASFNPTNAIPGISTVNHGFNDDDGANAIALQSDGKIILAGSTDGTPSSTFGVLVARLNADGTLNTSFGTGGMTVSDITPADDEFGNTVTLYSNRIYVAGSTGQPKDELILAYQNDGTALPLVLSSFYAQKQANKVVLQWQTSSEQDVKQFVIERSNDGKTYKTIGTVAATGNSTLTRHYSFADQSPYMSTGNYYRLLMQDIDGNYKYSKILIINFDGQLTTNLSIFPNPTKNIMQVQLPDGMNGTVALQVIDLNGRVVKFTNLASDGNALNTTLDVSSLTSGVYILKAQAGNITVTKRFLKK